MSTGDPPIDYGHPCDTGQPCTLHLHCAYPNCYLGLQEQLKAQKAKRTLKDRTTQKIILVERIFFKG